MTGAESRRLSAGSNGYTLIELMITVAIVGFLAAAGFKTAANMKATALVGQTKANLGIIRAALNLYRVYYKGPPKRLTQNPSDSEVDKPPSLPNIGTFGEVYCPKNPDASNSLAGWQILPNYAPNYNVQSLNALSYRVINTNVILISIPATGGTHPGGDALPFGNPTPPFDPTAEGWWYTDWNGGEVYPATQGERKKGEYYTLW